MMKKYIYDDKLVLKNGIWYASDSEVLSYPDDARDMLFALEDKSFWFLHRNQCIIEFMKFFPPQGTVFDVGGGNGFVSKGLSEAGFDVVHVEPGAGGALNAKKRGGFDVICAPFSKKYFRDHSANAVSLFDVMEHIENDSVFLREIHSLMQTGGNLYLTVPAYRRLWSQTDAEAGHFRRYTVASLRNVLRKNGFEVCFNSYIFSYLPFPIFLMRALPYKLGLRKETLAKKILRELTVGGGISVSALRLLNAVEVKRIKKGKRIPFGGSILMVTKKQEK